MTAIVAVGGGLIFVGLLCWLVIRLDSNRNVRSVRFNARFWKGVGINFQIERDTTTPDTAVRLPEGAVVGEPPAPATVMPSAHEWDPARRAELRPPAP